MPKLNQIVAVEKSVKSRVYGDFTELHKASQKAELFAGFSKNYRKRDEEGEDYPPESKRVQLEGGDVLTQVAKLMTELFDVTATKDFANCHALADVVVDGQTLVSSAPVPFLLFLEKQLTDLHTFVDKMPTLDPADEWQSDPNSGLFKTSSLATQRTKKVQKPVVLYDATDKHPAQTQLITEDVVIGYWDTVKQSGALPIPRKRELLDRLEKLSQAVKFAREQANDAEAEEKKVGAAVFGYLFS
jgi:hypothetical protein